MAAMTNGRLEDRYAVALFELASEQRLEAAVEGDLTALSGFDHDHARRWRWRCATPALGRAGQAERAGRRSPASWAYRS